MTNKEKAEEIYKDNKFELEVKGGVQDEQEILFMLEKMAVWKEKQMIENAVKCIDWLEKQGERKHTNSKDDERLKKTTIAFLKGFAKQGYENAVECIDWLEKQGEQKTEIEYIYPKFRIGDVIEQIQPNGNSQPVRVLSISKKIQSYCCESDDHNVYSSIPIRCENEYKLVEQKSTKWSEHQHKLLNYAISMTDDTEVKCFLESLRNTGSNTSADWSEEDEEMIRRIRCYLNEFGNWLSDKNKEKSQSIYKACDWLKSIKPNHWKPSEYDISLLEEIARNIRNNIRPFCSKVSALEDLIKNIKTL